MIRDQYLGTNNSQKISNEEFLQEALYDKFKKIFADEVKQGLLDNKEVWISDDIGYLTAEIHNQGTRSGAVIKNVKLKFVPTKKFRKEANKRYLNK